MLQRGLRVDEDSVLRFVNSVMSGLHVCLLVDSNFKRLTIGEKCVKQVPYLRCRGNVFCTYVINRRHLDWPSITDIKERRYTDLLIALGINHCKHGGENQAKAVSALLDYYREVRATCPDVRLYWVQVPPSMDPRINSNVHEFNERVTRVVRTYGVNTVYVPKQFYDEAGGLKPEFARPRELKLWYTGYKLHLSDDAQNTYCYVIGRVISKVTRQRIR